MGQVKAVKPTDIFSADEWRILTQGSRWRGLWLVAHAWGVIVLLIAGAVWLDHPVAWIIAAFLIGGRQLGLAILMHDAAHGHLHPDRKLNNFIGDWLCAAPVGTDLQAYRAYHLKHHAFTQQPEDPDLPLSAPFPTSQSSMLRKMGRDLTGITFLKQRGAQIKMALEGMKPDAKEQQVFIGRATIRFIGFQLMLLALSFASGYGILPFALWFVALATSFQLFLRIRNIAEHACTKTASDDPFSHARTTLASVTERALVAPYWVNYHLEHHLFMGVPCWNLPRAHRALMSKGYGPRMTVAEGYGEVLAEVTQPQPATV